MYLYPAGDRLLLRAPEITTDGKSAVITNGKIRCELMVITGLQPGIRRPK